jgi:hypothetical protein
VFGNPKRRNRSMKKGWKIEKRFYYGLRDTLQDEPVYSVALFSRMCGMDD